MARIKRMAYLHYKKGANAKLDSNMHFINDRKDQKLLEIII
jgi:hypothetical protein